MKKIEHIGIAVQNIEESIKTFESLLGSSCYKVELVESEYVKTAFFTIGESKIELLAATDQNSAIAKFLAKRGNGIHHIAFDVSDINYEIQRLTKLGFELIQQTPKDGADNKLIAFLHPKSTDGVLIELCQEKNVIFDYLQMMF
jgi:methylmalonyl-CoA/ethylmalonyl-CoA epimerase